MQPELRSPLFNLISSSIAGILMLSVLMFSPGVRDGGDVGVCVAAVLFFAAVTARSAAVLRRQQHEEDDDT